MAPDTLATGDATHVDGNACCTNEATSERLQIIDDEKHFNPDLSKQIEQWGLRDVGFDYNIVAVFGSQSTGKSTLLNALFGTDFDVMDESKRQQTTKGIWMCQGKDTNILVMDLEGTDGRERGEDRDFERKSAVFSLASSEILIINMWEYQIGWYNGANMSLLKTVFEVNLNIFGKMSSCGRTLLLFVIRDHYGGTPLANLRDTLVSDLSRIWDGLSKPPELENRLLSDYFDLEFTALPHKILVPDKFDAGVETLRSRFVNKGNSSYLFKDAYCKRVPADGVAFYMEGIWEQVRSAKDLDLPTQQELLAQFRCDEISAAVLVEFSGQARTQKRPIEDGQVVVGLGDMMKSWREQALAQYDRDASRYHKAVYARKRAHLTAALASTLSLLFLGQLKNLRKFCLAQFKEALRGRLQGMEYDFGGVVAEEKSKWEGDFEMRAKEALIEGTDWVWENELNSLQEEIEGVIGQCKKDERERVLNQVKKGVKKHISEPVKVHLDKGSNNMWDEIMRTFQTALTNAESTFPDKIKSSSGTDQENEYLLDSLRKDSWRVLRVKIDEETADAVFSSKLRRHFEDQFRYDKQGVPRVWEPEDDIEEAFKAAKKQALDFIPLYAEIKPQDFPPELNLLSMTTDAHEGEDEFDFKTSLVVFSKVRQTRIKNDLCRDADACYIEAKRSIVPRSGLIPSLREGLLTLINMRVDLFNPLPYMLLPLNFVGYTVTHLRPLRWITIWRAGSGNNSESEEIELKEVDS